MPRKRHELCHPKSDASFCPEDVSRAGGAELFSGFTGGSIFAVTPQLSLRGHTFFCLARKKYAKKRRRTRNSAYARKGVSLHFTYFRSPFRSPNALRAASSQAPYPSLCRKRQSSSISLLVLSKTQTLRWFVFWFLRASVFAPVEYLTYEIRDISDLA